MEIWLIIAIVMLVLSLGCLVASIWYSKDLQMPQKLCKHNWELMDKFEFDSDNGVEVETYTARVYQCEHCLKIKRMIDRY